MRPDWTVVELGAGRSTIWFSRRAARVIAFEDNPQWLDQLRRELEAGHVSNVEVRGLPVESFTSELTRLPDESVDLLVVDFLESPDADRVSAVETGRSKVRPGGCLVLDDSDRPAYAGAYELLDGWRERRFVGVKDGWPWVCETTIFRRPR